MVEKPIFAELREQLAERILFLDGALGTMVQTHALEESDFCGERFTGHSKDLKGKLFAAFIRNFSLQVQISLRPTLSALPGSGWLIMVWRKLRGS